MQAPRTQFHIQIMYTLIERRSEIVLSYSSKETQKIEVLSTFRIVNLESQISGKSLSEMSLYFKR